MSDIVRRWVIIKCPECGTEKICDSHNKTTKCYRCSNVFEINEYSRVVYSSNNKWMATEVLKQLKKAKFLEKYPAEFIHYKTVTKEKQQ